MRKPKPNHQPNQSDGNRTISPKTFSAIKKAAINATQITLFAAANALMPISRITLICHNSSGNFAFAIEQDA